MKREALMMLIAGTVLGAVLGFIGTRQYYMGKAAAAPAKPQAFESKYPDEPAAKQIAAELDKK